MNFENMSAESPDFKKPAPNIEKLKRNVAGLISSSATPRGKTAVRMDLSKAKAKL